MKKNKQSFSIINIFLLMLLILSLLLNYIQLCRIDKMNEKLTDAEIALRAAWSHIEYLEALNGEADVIEI